jgi:hypothetical protein
MTRPFLAALLALFALAPFPPAHAQACAGFTDVAQASPYCANVEWLKNREITLGCTNLTTFCPNDPVTRLSMAAFMNRLGNALTPVDLPQVFAFPAAVDTTSLQPVLCPMTQSHVVAGFPRRAYVSGAAHLSAPAAAVALAARILMSTDNGAFWLPLPGSDHTATLYPGSTPPQAISLAPYTWVDLEVGQSVRFAVGLARVGGSGTTLTASCNLSVQIGNRNSASSPLDP